MCPTAALCEYVSVVAVREYGGEEDGVWCSVGVVSGADDCDCVWVGLASGDCCDTCVSGMSGSVGV